MAIRSGTTSHHPVCDALTEASETVTRVVGSPTWSMTETDLGDALVAIAALEAQVAALRLRVTAQAVEDGAGGTTGATSTAAWAASHTRRTRPDCFRDARVAATLAEPRHRTVADALADGRVHLDQARAITDAVDALPADRVDARVRAEAATFLLDCAAVHDALELRALGRKVLEVVAPDVADEVERERLEREEREARRAATLTMSDDGHGTTRGRFAIPTEHGDRLRTLLDAIAAPKHQRARRATEDGGAGCGSGAESGAGPGAVSGVGSGVGSQAESGAGVAAGGERPSMPLRRGQALCELIERYLVKDLPRAGGLPATVTVTMSLETLMGGLGVATLSTGTRISAGRARMLACESGIAPVVLGGRSEVLDLGRAQRLFSPAQRRALEIEQGGCTAAGCDWPPGMCHAHHDVPWSRGGPTDKVNGRLLCPRHHARIHDPAYDTVSHPDGSVTFQRRC